MNRSGSHPDHENRLTIISTVLILRRGAPPGALAFIIFRGWGSQPPPVIPEGQFIREISSEFPFCVAEPAGIARVFRGNHSKQTDATLDILSILKAHFFQYQITGEQN